jgi:hypothetical protein
MKIILSNFTDTTTLGKTQDLSTALSTLRAHVTWARMRRRLVLRKCGKTKKSPPSQRQDAFFNGANDRRRSVLFRAHQRADCVIPRSSESSQCVIPRSSESSKTWFIQKTQCVIPRSSESSKTWLIQKTQCVIPRSSESSKTWFIQKTQCVIPRSSDTLGTSDISALIREQQNMVHSE